MLVVSYDGTDFNGYQVQRGKANARTVQSVLQKALCTVLQVDQASLSMNAAGRTDAGVHAAGQAVQFYVDCELGGLDRLHMRLNTLLPADVRVLRATRTPTAFSVRLHALWREYHYTLAFGDVADPMRRRHCAHVPGALDVAAMEDAVQVFEGTHDFGAFANTRQVFTDTVRTLHRARLVRVEGGVRLEFRGQGFLWKMVRHLVGSIIAVGRGKLTKGQIISLLEGGFSAALQRGAYRGWIVADACGLCKVHVEYGGAEVFP